MTATRSLSDFWRRGRSEDLPTELESVLQAANFLIGNMGSDVQVVWAGQGISYTDPLQRIVALDYSPLRGQRCPLPGERVDEVIGYAAHEGGHCLWSQPGVTETIVKEIGSRYSSLPESLQRDWQAAKLTVLAELRRIQNILEDAYIDRHVAQRWPVLGEYIRGARSRMDERTPLDLGAIAEHPCPDRNALLNLWTSVSLYGHPLPHTMSQVVAQTLNALQELTLQVSDESRPALRQALAVDAAAVVWEKCPVKQAPLPVRSGPKDLGEVSRQRAGQAGPGQLLDGPFGPEVAGPEATQSSDGRTAASKTPHDTGSCEEASQRQSTDQTPLSGPTNNNDELTGKGLRNLDEFDPSAWSQGQGRDVVSAPTQPVGRKSQWNPGREESLAGPGDGTHGRYDSSLTVEVGTAERSPYPARQADPQVEEAVQRIREVLQRQRDRTSRWRHGLEKGRLDDGQLWKAFVGEPSYYKRKEVASAPSLSIGLLLDVSRSMRPYETLIRQIAAAFTEGLARVPEVHFAAWSYSGEESVVHLTRIGDRQLAEVRLANLNISGHTPSGTAMAGAREALMRMPGKRRLLVHFTDGRADDPGRVVKAIRACRAAGVRVYALGLHQHEPMLMSQYGQGNYVTIRFLSQLPAALAVVLAGSS